MGDSPAVCLFVYLSSYVVCLTEHMHTRRRVNAELSTSEYSAIFHFKTSQDKVMHDNKKQQQK